MESAVPDNITPTEYLMMEVLVARYRLGEVFWHFPKSMRSIARKLDARGFTFWSYGITPDSIRVSLCRTGLEAWAPTASDVSLYSSTACGAG